MYVAWRILAVNVELRDIARPNICYIKRVAVGSRRFVCGKMTVALKIINCPQGCMNAFEFCQD